MIEGGARHLNLGGKLIFVVQRRLKMEGLLSSHFRAVEVLADSDIYRVWCANL
jgi:16S rRNA G1207 methylase RsmC